MLASASCGAWAFNNHDFSTDGIDVRLGWSIGGTMPLNMPASIRSLNSYTPQPNFQVGAGYEYVLNESWGIEGGLNLEKKGMSIDAGVKGYKMSMVKGGEVIEGYFNGNVVSKASTLQLSVPVQAVFHPSQKVKVKAGPYVAFALDRDFSGYAYDGYLRQDTPTGPRINIGSTETERGEYDFHDDLRAMNWGLDLGCDWSLRERIGVYADLTWGLNGVFKSSFHTIDQTMYPIYGTIGIKYKLK